MYTPPKTLPVLAVRLCATSNTVAWNRGLKGAPPHACREGRLCGGKVLKQSVPADAGTDVGRIPVSVQLTVSQRMMGMQLLLSHPSEHRRPLQRGHSSYNKMLNGSTCKHPIY